MGLFDFLKPKVFKPIIKYNLSSEKEEALRSSWQKVEELLSLGKPSQLKQGVIESDKITDSVLKELCYGSSMGERLKSARELFDRDVYNGLWEAHKVRNSLVHESSYDPPHYICKEAIAKYKSALLALNIRL